MSRYVVLNDSVWHSFGCFVSLNLWGLSHLFLSFWKKCELFFVSSVELIVSLASDCQDFGEQSNKKEKMMFACQGLVRGHHQWQLRPERVKGWRFNPPNFIVNESTAP